ncbi:MAG: hypothetical protein K0R19_2493, partial [Bacillota bacterium]|nr:hypothetical protein [Bacillota bacterium]
RRRILAELFMKLPGKREDSLKTVMNWQITSLHENNRTDMQEITAMCYNTGII